MYRINAFQKEKNDMNIACLQVGAFQHLYNWPGLGWVSGNIQDKNSFIRVNP
jgi:hypothetical protein